jgi:hypothetical protein
MMVQNSIMADVVTPLAECFPSLTEEERRRLAGEIERVVALRVLRSLAERAAQADAGYRFMDMMDRWVGVVVLGLLAVATLYFVAMEMALRGLQVLAGVTFEGGAFGLFWLGLAAVCAAYLAVAIRWLYRRSQARAVFAAPARSRESTSGSACAARG